AVNKWIRPDAHVIRHSRLVVELGAHARLPPAPGAGPRCRISDVVINSRLRPDGSNFVTKSPQISRFDRSTWIRSPRSRIDPVRLVEHIQGLNSRRVFGSVGY